jgi:hypothetical protein
MPFMCSFAEEWPYIISQQFWRCGSLVFDGFNCSALAVAVLREVLVWSAEPGILLSHGNILGSESK